MASATITIADAEDEQVSIKLSLGTPGIDPASPAHHAAVVALEAIARHLKDEPEISAAEVDRLRGERLVLTDLLETGLSVCRTFTGDCDDDIDANFLESFIARATQAIRDVRASQINAWQQPT